MTDLADLEDGDRVRVMFEGDVERYEQDADYLKVRDANGNPRYFQKNMDGLTVEKIEPPEPPYLIGRMYQDANDCYWEYAERMNLDIGKMTGCWYVPGDHMQHAFDHPSRPMRLMVPVDDDPPLRATRFSNVTAV